MQKHRRSLYHEMVEEIKEQIKAYCGLRFTEEELEYLHKIKMDEGKLCGFLKDCGSLDMKIMRLRRTQNVD